MTLTDLVTKKTPPLNRVDKTDGHLEHHLTEAAVMLAYAFFLFENTPNLSQIEIHPDGEHGKQFDIRLWLEHRGFNLIKPEGSTTYGGLYSNNTRSIYISLKPGLGDVVAETSAVKIVAECKGGIINTKHSCQKSRLRRGLCETVGLLMARPLEEEQQYAVVPETSDTVTVGSRMKVRCDLAGIKILLVKEDGRVVEPPV